MAGGVPVGAHLRHAAQTVPLFTIYVNQDHVRKPRKLVFTHARTAENTLVPTVV
jgi:hypothetical protein